MPSALQTQHTQYTQETPPTPPPPPLSLSVTLYYTRSHFMLTCAIPIRRDSYHISLAGLAGIRVAVYAFNNGGNLAEVFPLTKLTSSSVDGMRAKIMAIPQGPINPATAIGAAMATLADHAGLRLAGPHAGAAAGSAAAAAGSLGTVVLFSDGDPTKLVESEEEFDDQMGAFKHLAAVGAATDASASESCLFSIYPHSDSVTTMTAKALEADPQGWSKGRLNAFDSFSAPGCALQGGGSTTALELEEMRRNWTDDVNKLAVHILTEEVPRHVTCVDHPEECTCSLTSSPDHSHCCDVPTTATTSPTTVEATTVEASTATTTTTTTATTTTSTTTTPAPAQPQCACGQCVTCDDAPTCGLGVANPGFEANVIPAEFTYTRTTPQGWQFYSTSGAVGVSKYEKVVVSTTDGRFHRVTGQAVFLLAGALRQTTAVYPQENHDYVLTIRVVLDGAYTSEGVELRLEAGGAILADKYFSRAEINSKAGPGSSIQIIPLEVQFSARTSIPHPIEIVVDTLGDVVAESRAALFDDVRLCESTNACAPMYPRCDVAKTDYVALIDMSGSIDHAVVATEHAVTGVVGLYNATKMLPTGTASVRVAAYAFAAGDLQAETGPTVLKSESDLVQVVAGIRAMLRRRRPGQPTAIGAAMVSLASKAWFQTPAHVKIVALYSDGDPDRLENDAAFDQRLGIFATSMARTSSRATGATNDYEEEEDDAAAAVCLYSAQPPDASVAAAGFSRLRAFHTYSSTDGCRWNVNAADADPIKVWWDKKQVDWTASGAALYEDTLRHVVVPRQPCAANPSGCSCDYVKVPAGLDECCEDVCYPETTFTSTVTTTLTSTPTTTETTTTLTSTPTTTFTSTPTTTETTQLQHCGCDECITCESAMKCDADTVSGLENGNFEDGHAAVDTVVGVPSGWTILEGPLASALTQHADKFFGSAKYGGGGAGSSTAKHGGYIAQGGLRQASALPVKQNHEYSLRLKLVIDDAHTFSGCKVSLKDGDGTNAEVLVEADYPSTMYTAAQLRAGVDVEIGFTARNDGIGAGINIVVERTYAGSAFGESSLVMFDDVELCMQSNQCNPVYPACSSMDVNFVAMVDVSGSIQRKQAMLRQAVDTIAAVHEASKVYSPVSPRVHAAMYVFQKGEAVQVWPPAVNPSDGSGNRPAASSRLTDAVVRDLNATFDDFWVLQHVGELYALNGGTTIAKAMASLRMVAADGDTLFPHRASLGSVALFSDGDAFQTIENDDAFDRGMAEFRDNTDWISKETCLYVRQH